MTTEADVRERHTSTPDARAARTRAATAANKRRAAARAARELTGRLEHLDDEQVATLAAMLRDEANDRRLTIPDLR